jgi:HK97 family phage major capsid protein
MNREALLKELRALLDGIKAYKALDAETRTAEVREKNQAAMGRVAQIEADLKELDEMEAMEQRLNSSIKPVPNVDFSAVAVEDQPIYRGKTALGQQMVDIASMTIRSEDSREARSRFDQMVKREQNLAEKRAAGTGGMVMATGQDGGYLLQGETAMDMIQNGFNNSVVLSRAANRDLGTAQFVELMGIEETSRVAGSRQGGIRVYTDAELALMTQSKTKFEKIRLEPKRLTGMYFASDEILKNAPILQGEMEGLFREEFAFKGQDIAINGSGSGEGLGVLNAGCLVSVAKETGQVAATILFENLVKMKARVRLRSRASLVWLANQDVEPQLYTLSLPVGTGGSVMPVYVPSMNQDSGVAGTLLGIPIVFVEQCATLGTVGDIILGDWSMYYAANKGGIESASSIHLKFDYNQTAFRFVTWFDGQPRVKSALTPYKGTNTVSPFVALATRS